MIGGIFDEFLFLLLFLFLSAIINSTKLLYYTHSQIVLGVESDIIQR